MQVLSTFLFYSAKNTSGVSPKMEALRCLCYNKLHEIQKAEPCGILHKISHSDIDQIPKKGTKERHGGILKTESATDKQIPSRD